MSEQQLGEKMMLYGKKYGGADPQLIEGDSFRMVISVPEFSGDPAKSVRIVPAEEGIGLLDQQPTQQVTQQVAPQVTQQVKKLLIACVGEMGRAALMQKVDIKDRVSFSRNYLEPAIMLGLLEKTQPDSPTSPTQRYRLTDEGRSIVEILK